jgi:hypothetical protein
MLLGSFAIVVVVTVLTLRLGATSPRITTMSSVLLLAIARSARALGKLRRSDR